MNAVVIDNCGGEDARNRMAETSKIVREQGRRILIYIEKGCIISMLILIVRLSLWRLILDSAGTRTILSNIPGLQVLSF